MRLCLCFKFFAYVCVWLLSTYTAFAYVCVRLLCMLCGFCVRIRLIFCASCAAFDSLKVSMIQSWGFFDLLKVLMIRSWGFFDFILYVQKIVINWKSWGFDLEVPSSSLSARDVHYDWTVWRIRYLGFRRVLYPRELFVMIGPYRGSDILGSVKFFIWRSARY